MKIIHRLIGAYFILALMMIAVGYLSLKENLEIKNRIVRFQNDSVQVFGKSEELLTAIENCQKSVQTLIDNKPKIIYSYAEAKTDETSFFVEKKLKSDLDKIETMLTPIVKTSLYEPSEPGGKTALPKNVDLKDWLELRKKHFYYHWKYLSHFINLTDGVPEQAADFFERTLEPHYRRNIFPIINKYRQGEQEAKDILVKNIIEKYIPNATRVIIISTLISLFSIFFVGFWISRSISKPLNKLTSAALLIGKGNLDTRINIKSKNEIGILARAFNRMTRDLSKTTVSKTYVDNIIKSMLDTLIVIDSNAIITKVNKSTLNLLGYERHELVGKSIYDIISHESSKCRRMIRDLPGKGLIANIETIYVTKQGAGIPMLFSGAVMYGDKGNILGIVCVARDIMERKESELALQKAYDEMERRVEQRTADLLEANRHLKNEIAERVRTEDALRKSENRLRRISSHILSAQEKEKHRLSLELHDDLGQSLSLLKVQLSAIERKIGQHQVQWSDSFNETLQYLDFIIENVRRLSRDLRPSILEDLGLTAAIRWLSEEFAKHHQITSRGKIENVDDCFSKDSQIIIYRIFQEIFSNIGKHAQARSFTVCVSRLKDAVKVAVKDDGKGFDKTDILSVPTPEKGIGLAAMRERALMLGSDLDITSRPGSGTRVEMKIPAKARREAS